MAACCTSASGIATGQRGQRPAAAPQRHQNGAGRMMRPQQQQQQRRQQRVAATGAATGGASNGSTASPVIGAPQQQHVIRMVNIVHTYFDKLLTEGDVSLIPELLEPSISHKDMVRNIGRLGTQEYEKFLVELHQTYPDYYVKPLSFGFVDNKSLFVSFEGQVSAKSPKFNGVDLFLFNDSATRIREVQVFRSNWLGAQGHEERKKLAEAAARVEAQAVAQRGQLP